MCWSQTSSIITLVLGSFLNIISYIYLTKKKSQAARFVPYWQFCLLMQIPEAIVWNFWNNSMDVSGPSHIAMILNVFQPIMLLLCVITDLKHAFVAIFMYVLLISTEFGELWSESDSIAPKEECHHLNLGYWNLSRTMLYVFSSMICFIEFSSKFWGILNMILFLITLVLAVTIYECGGGSLWCWMISGTGIILVVAECLNGKCDSNQDKWWIKRIKNIKATTSESTR